MAYLGVKGGCDWLTWESREAVIGLAGSVGRLELANSGEHRGCDWLTWECREVVIGSVIVLSDMNHLEIHLYLHL